MPVSFGRKICITGWKTYFGSGDLFGYFTLKVVGDVLSGKKEVGHWVCVCSTITRGTLNSRWGILLTTTSILQILARCQFLWKTAEGRRSYLQHIPDTSNNRMQVQVSTMSNWFDRLLDVKLYILLAAFWNPKQYSTHRSWFCTS